MSEHPPEPWRIKVVEPIQLPSRAEREQQLKDAHYNIFNLPSKSVYIDLMTDSGTSAMSSHQWSKMMLGDESYAGTRSFSRFEAVVRDLFGFPHVMPTHQGRAAEHLLYAALVRPGATIPGNNHFDTARAHIENNQGIALDLAIAEATDFASDHGFKGNIDLKRLADTLSTLTSEQVGCVTITLTNNMSGGQPASLANIRGVASLCRQHSVPFFIDASRFSENAWFIQQHEEGQYDRPIRDIVREMFDNADGCTMSAKKDGLSNIGGFVACRDPELAERIKQSSILHEGFPTYGGLAGRDLEAVARGLEEVVDPAYLRFRTGQVAAFGEAIADIGIPVIRPFGGHGVYLDAAALFPHIPPELFPGIAGIIALYREGAIRACEMGSAMQGRRNEKGRLVPATAELIRLCLPRRVYTNSHLAYVVKVLDEIYQKRDAISGFKVTFQPPGPLGHFSAHFLEL